MRAGAGLERVSKVGRFVQYCGLGDYETQDRKRQNGSTTGILILIQLEGNIQRVTTGQFGDLLRGALWTATLDFVDLIRLAGLVRARPFLSTPVPFAAGLSRELMKPNSVAI